MDELKNFKTFESNMYGLSGEQTHTEVNSPIDLKPQFQFGEKFGDNNDIMNTLYVTP